MPDEPTPSSEPQTGGAIDRRRLLGAIGVGAGATAVGATAAVAQDRGRNRGDGRGRPNRAPDGDRANRFTRIFDDLPPFAEPTAEVVEALRAIGEPGGIMDAGDDLTAAPIDLGTDPALSVDNPNHPSGPTGSPRTLSMAASRNLLRHLTWQIPSGQRVAAAMGVDPLSPADLSDLEPFGNRLQQSTPLWFYVLREADLIADGAHLGPVGGRIVAEVLIGLMRADSGSWLNTMPDWQPTLPMADPAAGFRMTDLLRFAGVDPESRRAA